MTDIIIIGLLLIIILILISVYAPELIFYGLFAFCIIALMVLIIVAGAQFIHDPVGFIYNLVVTNNPVIVFTDNILSAMPTFGSDVPTPSIAKDRLLVYGIITWEIFIVSLLCYGGYKMFFGNRGKRKDDNGNEEPK